MVIDRDPALTFDDVLLKPGYAGFFREDVDFSTQLTREIVLDVPIVSSPMDTVTDSRLAIALGSLGAIGIIHRNLTIEDQAAEVEKVHANDLLVGAAVASSPGFEKRVEALCLAGADVLLVDAAHGHSLAVESTTAAIKRGWPGVQLISGSIATKEGAKALIDAGADGLRLGMGPGAICSTRLITGMGVPQMTALENSCGVAQENGVPVIADGGIVNSGDIVKALAAGASSVMLGRMFAAVEESCGDKIRLPKSQVPSRFKNILREGDEAEWYWFKNYRGMGSKGAMKKGREVSSEDEFHGKSYDDDSVMVAEGVDGLVPVSGTAKNLVDQLVGGIRSGMYDVGSRTLPELWEDAHFQVITPASLHESHPHDLFVTDDGGNLSF